jgi:type II secretory pathway pseudopilin PulG
MMHFRRSQLGMTLVEMVITIGIFSLLTGMIFTAANSFYRTNKFSAAQAQEIDNARRGMALLTRDLREMTYAEDGTFPVALIDDHQIGFYSDIDKDDSVEYVEYELSTTTLYKRTFSATGTPPVYDFVTPESTIILSQFVQNIDQGTTTFFYFDTNNTQLASTSMLTDVRYIKAQIIVNVNPIESPGEFLLRSGVAPRNLKDNL